MNNYRFYDSSILITYDGVSGTDNNDSLVNVHIIDFSHVQIDKNARNTNDDGYLFGLKNLIEKLEKIKIDIAKESKIL